MSDLLCEIHEKIMILTLNRVEKSNAFDDVLLSNLLEQLQIANENPDIRVILLKANGKHFSAGADLEWMQRMAGFSEAENFADAKILAQLMYELYNSKKPTLAMIQGVAFGGGAGLVAACDIAIAAHSAKFCFSEVKLGLIPAVISPYVIQAIGERWAKYLFLNAEVFDTEKALQLGFIHQSVKEENLLDHTLNLANALTKLPPQALVAAKSLIFDVSKQPIDSELLSKTAAIIAKIRVSEEGQKGIKAFLKKETIDW